MGARVTELDSGARVVSESRPGVESATFGLYFPTGSRDETREINGISHLIEHLVFKGTEARTAEQINREIDLLGGASNAYTSKETLCFHARVLAEDVPRIVDLYADMVSGSLPRGVDPEVERERSVILAEIASVDDSPEDLVGDLCDVAYFGDHPLALPVVGSARAVERLDLPRIRSHLRSHVVARDMVVAAAGKVDHDALVALAREKLAALPIGEPRDPSPAPSPRAGTHVLQRDLEQVQLCLSARGVARGDRRRATAEVLSTLLGDGVSSRLFREVRDKRGLAYSIYSSLVCYLDAGSLNVHCGVAPDRLAAALEVIARVLADVRAGPVPTAELEAAKAHLRASTILAYETPGARMGYIAEAVLLGDERLDVERELEEIAAVTVEEVAALARELLDPVLAMAVVGPVDDERLPADGLRLPA